MTKIPMTKIPNSKQFLFFSISLCLYISIFLYFCCSVSAQSPTSPPTPTASATEANDKKVREIRDQVREKIQEKIQEIKEKGKQKAYVGEILNIDGLNITLETRGGERAITIDQDAAIIGPKREKLDIDDLAVGDLLICMGYVNSEGLSADSADKMIAKRIVVTPESPKPPILRQAVYGQVTEIDENSTLTLIHPRKENSTLRVETASKTKITKKVEGLPAGRQDKIQKVNFSEIEINDRVAAVGSWDEKNEVLTAKLIHIIPGKTEGQGE